MSLLRIFSLLCLAIAVSAGPCATRDQQTPCQAVTSAPCPLDDATTQCPCQKDKQLSEDITLETTKKAPSCEDGWELFEDSCYLISKTTATQQRAEQICLSQGATLFVANSEEEYKAIMKNSSPFIYTWIGLFKKDENTNPQWNVANQMSIENLDWLIKPYEGPVNGWSTVSQCAAHYNSGMKAGQFLYWYPCSFEFHYICERNSTVLQQPLFIGQYQ